MARPLRIEYPGAFYHVISRGINKRKIFLQNKDYKRLLYILSRLHQNFQFIIHSFCLMENHYHFYMETPEGNLSRIMQNLNAQYTQYFNHAHKRVGPLLQGRYKATLVDHDHYSLTLSRYIHLNPVKSKKAKRPEDYPHSSYKYFFNTNGPNFLATDWLLSQYSRDSAIARREYRKFHEISEDEHFDPEKEAFGQYILGTQEFIEKIKRDFIPKKKDSSIARLRGFLIPDNIDKIREVIAQVLGEHKNQKKALVYFLKMTTPMKLEEIADLTGMPSAIAVSQCVRRFGADLESDPRLKAGIDLIGAKICQM